MTYKAAQEKADDLERITGHKHVVVKAIRGELFKGYYVEYFSSAIPQDQIQLRRGGGPGHVRQP